MKILIIGLGNIGQRHLRLLKDYFSHEIWAFRHKKSEKPNIFGIKEIFSWKNIKRNDFDVAFVCNPTYLHIETAMKCAVRDMALFIEKPIDNKLTGLQDLLDLVKARSLITYVAYPFRYYIPIQQLKKTIKNRKINYVEIVCRTNIEKWPSYRKRKDQGGGALLELSHELDYAQYLFGDYDIAGKIERRSNVVIDAEDYADLILYHNSKIKAHVILDIANDYEERYIKIRGTGIIGTVYLKNQDQMYLNQLNYFFNNIDNPNMMNNLFEASGLFKKIIELRESK
jgi:predicted dehydrogenase